MRLGGGFFAVSRLVAGYARGAVKRALRLDGGEIPASVASVLADAAVGSIDPQLESLL